MQALADVLETAKVVENDKWIVGWPLPRDGGLPLRKDAVRPRLEIWITEAPAEQAAQLELING